MRKKKLLFIYIDGFRGFCKKEFNFCADIRFHYDEVNNILLLNQDDNVKSLPNEFWASNISDVNLLIGNNGSGKTRAIKTICQWICQLSVGMYPLEKGIFVFQEKNDLKYISFYQKKKMEIICEISGMDLLPEDCLIDFFHDLKLVYFSNTMTGLDTDDYDILLNYAMPNRIDEANSYGPIADRDIIVKYRQHEFDRQYNLFKYRSQKFDLIEQNENVFPKYIQMEVFELKFSMIGSLLEDEDSAIEKDLSDLWDTNFKRYINNISDEKFLILELLRNLLIGVICNLIKWERKNEVSTDKKIVIEELKKILFFKWSRKEPKIKAGCEWLREFLKDILIDCRIHYSKNRYGNDFNKFWGERIVENINEFIDMASEQFYLERANLFEIFEMNHESLKAASNIWQISTDDKTSELFRKFWEIYSKISFCMNNVFLYWNASSGQQNWMSLFSVLCDASLKEQNICLFLDEPDNTFHPEWERHLLNWIIKSCEINRSVKNIQIFIATHSPIMLSDVPGISVSYLSDRISNLDTETFGQNLYVLFNQSLCLQKGVLGVFASNKIIDILKEIRDLEKSLFNKKNMDDSQHRIEECEKVIEIVAEPVFKNQMQLYLAKCKELVER
ncbi:hypothetical protein IMSAGC012_03717 [Lachnospiraceae bacterium]|nr:hypothetical protein IMSAGC012_03717 [Lachnospiraceae bacterium]